MSTAAAPVFPCADPSLLPRQMCASLVLLSAATLMGLMSYFFADKKHRRAFLETRQSLEVKMVIEEQSREQVCTVCCYIPVLRFLRHWEGDYISSLLSVLCCLGKERVMENCPKEVNSPLM